MPAASKPLPECWICGKPCPLENCKIDERGCAVHEECYIAKLAQKNVEPIPE